MYFTLSLPLSLTLTDKSAGGKFKKEFEDASQRLQEYFECVGIEVTERENLLNMLGDCKKYHQERLTELEGLLKVVNISTNILLYLCIFLELSTITKSF